MLCRSSDMYKSQVRKDIADMFCGAEFLLLPTFKTYLDTVEFLERAGVKNRKERDRSPRRPLTALPSRSGLYRYVFVACSDAARALQEELGFKPQTDEDLGEGVRLLDGNPLQEGTDQFPVVECRVNPLSVCTLADRLLPMRSTTITGQWHYLIYNVTNYWLLRESNPPAWFLDAPKYDHDDFAQTTSEASGYEIQPWPDEYRPDPFAILGNADVAETDERKAVAAWVCNKVDPDAPPPEEQPICVEYKLRRSDRIRRKACPYERSPDGPPPSPVRNVARALIACRRDPVTSPPAWAQRNGQFPTHMFSSNDWAYFQYGLHLATPPDSPSFASSPFTRSTSTLSLALATLDVPGSPGVSKLATLQLLAALMHAQELSSAHSSIPDIQIPSRNRMYRYVYVAYSEEARALQVELDLKPQTNEDLNGGISPLDGKPYRAGTDQFPVVECHVNPLSVCTLADRILQMRSTSVTGQWHALIYRVMNYWVIRKYNPPDWFLKAPMYDHDDFAQTPSEASGYEVELWSDEPRPDPFAILSNADLAETDERKVVADWVCNKVDPDAPPPEEQPIRVEYKLRRSDRIRRKACPYERSPDGPPPSPVRNVARALVACRRDPVTSPPAWAQRNGQFPTHRFSSNDWAYFQYGLHLATSPDR
ncbi:hypothetical protein HDZ31DRAFT_37189 [Schizophyllum fasciatum]